MRRTGGDDAPENHRLHDDFGGDDVDGPCDGDEAAVAELSGVTESESGELAVAGYGDDAGGIRRATGPDAEFIVGLSLARRGGRVTEN